MEFSAGGGSTGASGDEQEASNPRRGKKPYHRHTISQIQQLEAFFRECPHPDDNQRRQLSRELGLEPKQIKFWFQNKRTQTKTQNERADNSVLRAENERIQCENLAIREALKNVICPSCGGPPFGEEERQRSLHILQLENAQLKEEHEKLSNLLAKYIGRPITNVDSLAPPMLGASFDFAPISLPTQRMGGSCLGIDLNVAGVADNFPIMHQQHFNGMVSDVEKALMSDAATTAMEELLRLLRVTEPLWVKSSAEGRHVLHRDSYEKIFPRDYHFKGSNVRVESSKESGVVPMSAIKLVDMFLDPNKWVDLFPTLVTEARTIFVLQDGLVENRSGSLQLMYEQMHILSPLVPPREFYFLRFCHQIEAGMWVIVDVSYDCLKEFFPPSRSWRLPSGCIIQDMSNGFSKVTWVEHVEVDDKTQTHRLYRDLICGGSAYGAERWIVTLQRMCERYSFSTAESHVPTREIGGVITSPEGRRSIMKLSHRMVKNFCATLSISKKMDFPQLSEVNNSGVRISFRKNTQVLGEPTGMIVNAATSVWLPLPPNDVFNFFSGDLTRFQWDIISNGNPMHQIALISHGAHPGNFISLLRPFIPSENNVLILQECCIDKSASLLVYAPIDIAGMNLAINCEDSSIVPILPSGIIISGDGRPESAAINNGPTTNNNNGSNRNYSNSISANINGGRSPVAGTLLTVAFQILIASSSSAAASKEPNMDSLATINTLVSSTVQKIRVALNCSSLD